MRSNLRKKRGCLKNHIETPPAFNSRPQAARSAQQTVFAPIKKTRLAQKTNSQSSEAIASLRGGATERVRDDFLMQSIKKSSRTCTVRDDMCFHYTIDEHTSCRSDSDQLQNQARFCKNVFSAIRITKSRSSGSAFAKSI